MSPAFQTVQHDFADYLRDPASHPAPGGIEARRLQIYADLFYSNIEGFLAQCFPVLQEILASRNTWHPACRSFFSDQRCSTPYFAGIPTEFIRWLQKKDYREDLPPFAADLAHYEWSELDVDLDPATTDVDDINPGGNLLAQAPILAPVHRLLSYQWPVSRIGTDFQPANPLPEPERLLLFRDRDDRVRFTGINIATWTLLQGIRVFPLLSGAEQLHRLGLGMPQMEPAAMLQFGGEILEQLHSQGAILGTRRTTFKTPPPTGRRNNHDHLPLV